MLRPAICVLLAVPLAAQGWVDRTPTNPLGGPAGRRDPVLCWDPVHGYVLMVNGWSNTTGISGDTWSWNGTSWTQRNATVGTGTTLPASRAMAFHSPANEVLLVSYGSTVAWDGNTWFARSASLPNPPLAGFGTVPFNVALGRDEARNQTVLFVGSRHDPAGSNADLSETMVWDGFAWSPRPTATHPYPVQHPSMAFDPMAGRLLLCTNDSASTQTFFWEWNGSNWQQRSYSPAPAIGGVMTTDTLRNRVVMFDGSLDPQPNHTWTFANGTSTRLGLTAEPAHRWGAGMGFDPVRGVVVMFGGANFPPISNSSFELADTWEFTLGAGAAWSSFGAGCVGSRGVPVIAAQGTSLPRIGQTFELHVGNLPFTGPVFLFFGLSNTSYGPTPLPFALNGLGAPGCSVLCSGEELVVLTNVLGTAVWQRAIPNFPGLTFYNQAFAFDPAANALGLATSNGGQGVIGL